MGYQMSAPSMTTPEALAAPLAAGRSFFLAGSEELLSRVPKGSWVGGTSSYFIADEGGLRTRDRLSAVELPAFAAAAEVKVYDARSLSGVYSDAPDNGFSLIVIPAGTRTLRSFGLDVSHYADFASRPLFGWVSGVELPDVGKVSPKVFDGRNGRAYDDAAVVMHVTLPKAKSAEIEIVNMFEPGDGDVLIFESDGFSAVEVLVGGKRAPFARYLREKGLDIRLPLVADYDGVMVNASFQGVDEASQAVRFYAPVFRGVRYRHARPIGDYFKAFSDQLAGVDASGVVCSCNCVLNYLYAGLEGRRTPGFAGPTTFGEIAYQLLNQTLVYLKITDANLSERLRGETARRKRVRALEAAAQDLEAFNAMVSHDLRAPLRRMIAFSEMMRQSPAVAADEAAGDCARRIAAAAGRMSNLLDDLLDFSRAGCAKLNRVPVDLDRLVEEVRQELSGEWGARSVSWDARGLGTVEADPSLLRQVLVNLLSNAVKFTRDRAEARIEVRAGRSGLATVVSVRDNGAGFDPRYAAKLFQPCQRLHTAQEFPGTGIGLAIVARIVARHGGRVWAESEPGRGAVFHFSIPDP